MNNTQHQGLTKERLANAMAKIESDITLSFHHWSNELDIPVQDLQNEWAEYSYKKRGTDETKNV